MSRLRTAQVIHLVLGKGKVLQASITDNRATWRPSETLSRASRFQSKTGAVILRERVSFLVGKKRRDRSHL